MHCLAWSGCGVQEALDDIQCKLPDAELTLLMVQRCHQRWAEFTGTTPHKVKS